MPEQSSDLTPSYQKFKLPPKIKLPKLDNGYEAELRAKEIIDDGVEASLSAINAALSRLDEGAYDRVDAAAKEADTDVPDYLRRHVINVLAFCYVEYRTGEVHILEGETNDNATQQYISSTLTELSEMIGEHVTMEIYRTLAGNMDAAIGEHTGRTK
jgi:hypothetical protein